MVYCKVCSETLSKNPKAHWLSRKHVSQMKRFPLQGYWYRIIYAGHVGLSISGSVILTYIAQNFPVVNVFYDKRSRVKNHAFPFIIFQLDESVSNQQPALQTVFINSYRFVIKPFNKHDFLCNVILANDYHRECLVSEIRCKIQGMSAMTRLSSNDTERAIALVNHMLLSHSEAQMRYDFCAELQHMLSNEFRTQVLVYPFGSLISRTCLVGGDLDLHVKTPYTKQPVSLNDICRLLRNCHNFVGNIQPIFMTRVPIVRFVVNKYRFSCDLNVQSPLGVFNSNVIRVLFESNTKAWHLALLFRLWIVQMNLSSAITNYRMNTLVLFYLQQPTQRMFPAVDSLLRHDWSVEGWKATLRPNIYHNCEPRFMRISLFDLFTGLLRYYAEFDFSTYVVCPNCGCSVARDYFRNWESIEQQPTQQNTESPEKFHQDVYVKRVISGELWSLFIKRRPCVIQDMLELNINIGAAIKEEALRVFQKQCGLAATKRSIMEILSMQNDLPEVAKANKQRKRAAQNSEDSSNSNSAANSPKNSAMESDKEIKESSNHRQGDNTTPENQLNDIGFPENQPDGIGTPENQLNDNGTPENQLDGIDIPGNSVDDNTTIKKQSEIDSISQQVQNPQENIIYKEIYFHRVNSQQTLQDFIAFIRYILADCLLVKSRLVQADTYNRSTQCVGDRKTACQLVATIHCVSECVCWRNRGVVAKRLRHEATTTGTTLPRSASVDFERLITERLRADQTVSTSSGDSARTEQCDRRGVEVTERSASQQPSIHFRLQVCVWGSRNREKDRASVYLCEEQQQQCGGVKRSVSSERALDNYSSQTDGLVKCMHRLLLGLHGRTTPRSTV